MESTTGLGTCQVRSETDHPCQRPAVAEFWGVRFCERCAREQERYMSIGELTELYRRAAEYSGGFDGAAPEDGRGGYARDGRPLASSIEKRLRSLLGFSA